MTNDPNNMVIVPVYGKDGHQPEMFPIKRIIPTKRIIAPITCPHFSDFNGTVSYSKISETNILKQAGRLKGFFNGKYRREKTVFICYCG